MGHHETLEVINDRVCCEKCRSPGKQCGQKGAGSRFPLVEIHTPLGIRAARQGIVCMRFLPGAQGGHPCSNGIGAELRRFSRDASSRKGTTGRLHSNFTSLFRMEYFSLKDRIRALWRFCADTTPDQGRSFEIPLDVSANRYILMTVAGVGAINTPY